MDEEPPVDDGRLEERIRVEERNQRRMDEESRVDEEKLQRRRTG